MIQVCIKAGAVLALASLAAAGQALAVTPLSLTSTAPLVILAQDEENEEVWHDLRPDITPPEAAVGKREETRTSPRQRSPWVRARAISRIRSSGTIWKPA